ncbi:hypothetical protein CRUP_023982 [Coryphaenoides rupestris]|nr:hypothetical protein CRUP_023982 [Coryphaenoides rupestris]
MVLPSPFWDVTTNNNDDDDDTTRNLWTYDDASPLRYWERGRLFRCGCLCGCSDRGRCWFSSRRCQDRLRDKPRFINLAMSTEDVERIADETQEAVEYRRRIDEPPAWSRRPPEDEDAVLAELEAIAQACGGARLLRPAASAMVAAQRCPTAPAG